ncbi:hypothetical protein [Bradyrhizobium sp. S69]|uniref:hypothetical protein n=1 Tax=Bradyrhizobium sp. S69 TaxID=1641856 RepID=UPI00131E64CD|nr:hypothetical protein [Bradyrhizobium sp. S69]
MNHLIVLRRLSKTCKRDDRASLVAAETLGSSPWRLFDQISFHAALQFGIEEQLFTLILIGVVQAGRGYP